MRLRPGQVVLPYRATTFPRQTSVIIVVYGQYSDLKYSTVSKMEVESTPNSQPAEQRRTLSGGGLCATMPIFIVVLKKQNLKP